MELQPGQHLQVGGHGLGDALLAACWERQGPAWHVSSGVPSRGAQGNRHEERKGRGCGQRWRMWEEGTVRQIAQGRARPSSAQGLSIHQAWWSVSPSSVQDPPSLQDRPSSSPPGHKSKALGTLLLSSLPLTSGLGPALHKQAELARAESRGTQRACLGVEVGAQEGRAGQGDAAWLGEGRRAWPWRWSFRTVGGLGMRWDDSWRWQLERQLGLGRGTGLEDSGVGPSGLGR